MNGAIFFSSKYGSTAEYAGWIGDATGLPVYSVTDSHGDPADYDFLVLGSPIMHYRLSIRRWLKRHAAQVLSRPTILFTVSGAPAGLKLDGWMADSLPDSLVSHVQHVALRGRSRPEDLTRWDRITQVMGGLMNRDSQAREEELQGFDYMDKSSIGPVIDLVRELQASPAAR
ncbi:MAG: flavodoxin domain-containing protein [Acidimicrobiales bacterium]